MIVNFKPSLNYKLTKIISLISITSTVLQSSLIVAEEPMPVNISNPHGKPDIVQLWENEDTEGVMRNALKPRAQNRWIRYKDSSGNYVIPYVIGGSFSSSQLRIIQGAMDSIAKNTCIKFQKRKSEYDYVEIQNKKDEGCYTMVGRAPGKNVVMLEANSYATCVLHETVIHELMHTIGLWHEQMRYDRDQYIRVHYENIPQSLYAQFKKVPKSQSTTYGVKYDYKSVMHYTKDAFAMIPGEITMETKDPKAQNIIGNVKNASPGDYAKICSIYKCSKCMGRKFTGVTSTSANKKSGEHKSTGSFSDFSDFIDNIFKFKPANEEMENSNYVAETNSSVGKHEDSRESENGHDDNVVLFERDFFDLLQDDDEVDVEHDSWAKTWLDSLHNNFPDLADTWEIDFVEGSGSSENPLSLSIPRSIFENRRSIEIFGLGHSSKEHSNDESKNGLFSLFGINH